MAFRDIEIEIVGTIYFGDPKFIMSEILFSGEHLCAQILVFLLFYLFYLFTFL